MKNNLLLLFVASILLSGCYKDYGGLKAVSHLPGLQETIDKIKESPTIDDTALLEALQTTGMVLIDEYYQKNNGKWSDDNQLTSASFTILCFENEAYTYSKLMYFPVECYGPYPLKYDADTNTLYTTSVIRPNEEHAAIVKYFDGEIVILDGLFMPAHDMYNDDYDEYRYISTYRLDKDMRENYEELL